MVKSLCVTYFLWLFGGLFGLHHFYLGRDSHALVWWMFVGGYFGFGWLRDLWRIPEYVQDANETPSYIEKLTSTMKQNKTPPGSSARFFGQMIVADAFGYLIQGAFPYELLPEWLHFYSFLPVPFAAAIGVHLVGNIGRHEGNFWVPCLAAYLPLPLYLWNPHSVFWSSLAASVAFNNITKKWRRKPSPKRSLAFRLLVLSLCGALYLSLWGSWFYFNCSMIDKNEEKVKCREAAKHFLTSPMWQQFQHVIRDLFNYWRYHGWNEMWNHLYQSFDPHGEVNALHVLNLTSSATQEEITSRYRKLSRQYHPDRHKGEEQKRVAQDTFINIQHAYEILSKMKTQRMVRNKKNRETVEEL